MIDAHQHFWTLARGDYAWPNDSVSKIFRDFGPNDLTEHLTAAGITQTVLVQATDSVAETEFLLALAQKHSFIAGVVGWVDLAAPDAIDTINQLRQSPHLRGLRPMLQNIAQTDWILNPALAPALRHMEQVGLRFDALIHPRHLGPTATLAERHPDLWIVIDHMAKPQMGDLHPPDPVWRDRMERLARYDNVMCKLSGMVTEAGPGWTQADLRPFAEVVLRQFGPDRVMFGSDWPVVNLASDYQTWIAFVRELIAPLPKTDQSKILGETARRFYQLPQ